MTAPSDWRWSTVGEAGDVDLGRQRHPDWHTGPEMRPYLRVANVFEDRIDTTDLKEMDFSGCFERYKLHPGDVLLNEGQSPELLGRPAIYRGQPEDVAFTNTLIRFRPHPGVTPEWALLVFRHHMHSGRFARESRITTNIAHLSSTRLKSVEFPVPPLPEQLRIVAILEEHLINLANGEANLGMAGGRLRGIREAAMQRVLSDYSTSMHELSDLCAAPLANGRSVRTREGGFPVLRLTAMKDGRVDLKERKAGDWTAAEAAPFLVRRGDFMVTRGNGSLRLVGRGALVDAQPDEVAFPDTMIRIRAKANLIDPRWLVYAWNSSAVRAQIERMARTSAGIYKVSQANLSRVKVPTIPIDRQPEALARLSSIQEHNRRVRETIELALLRSRALRTSLLAAAFSGRLTGRSSESDMIEELAEGKSA